MFDYRKGSNIKIIIKIFKDISKTSSEKRVMMRIYKCLNLKLEIVGRMLKGKRNSRYGILNQGPLKNFNCSCNPQEGTTAPLPWNIGATYVSLKM